MAGTSEEFFFSFTRGKPSTPAVANAIKLLQACIYKSVNIGLFSTTLVAVATSIFKIMFLMLDS